MHCETMHKILICGKIHADGIALLAADRQLTLVHLNEDRQKEVFADDLTDIDGILLRTQSLTRAHIENAPKLKIVSRHGVGYDAVDVEALNERKIPLAIVGDVNAPTVAEHTFFLLLGIAKQALFHDQAVRNGQWRLRDMLQAVELDGKKLLLVGYGRIGRLVARLGQAFSMQMIVYDPFLSQQNRAETGLRLVEDLKSGLEQADFVSLHAPLDGRKGKYMIGEQELGWMKPSAFLVNTSRGGHVDLDALHAALQGDRLAGAGLDVFAQEPLDHSHPIATNPKVLFSPHIAGLTQECAKRMAVQSAQNILDALKQRLDLKLVVNAAAVSPKHGKGGEGI